MVSINEFLPNPVGKDTDGEFIELYNSGLEKINLAGYFLRDKAGKSFYLDGYLEPYAYLTLPYSLTKIAINNNEESIFLYGANGELLEKVEFLGSAPEGASYAKREELFIFTDTPTPGTQNKFATLEKFNIRLSTVSHDSVILHKITMFELALLSVILGVVFGATAAIFLKNAITQSY